MGFVAALDTSPSEVPEQGGHWLEARRGRGIWLMEFKRKARQRSRKKRDFADRVIKCHLLWIHSESFPTKLPNLGPPRSKGILGVIDFLHLMYIGESSLSRARLCLPLGNAYISHILSTILMPMSGRPLRFDQSTVTTPSA